MTMEARSPFSRLRPLPLTAVRLHDVFWEPRRQINRTVSLPTQYELCEETGRLDNFRRAAGIVGGEFRGRIFNDSDVYKWLEAAAWSLANDGDPVLISEVNAVVSLIAAAQDSNGYLDTYFTFERTGERWTDLTSAHEMYCAGHLIQAAIAHHRVLGTPQMLDVAVRLADHIAGTFGPHARQGADGHPEVEMALVELARETGEERYVRQARFFIDQRGQTPPVISGEEYHQDHAPFLEQCTAVGHAVRALYLYSGATDVYMETGDRALWETLLALWRDLQEHKVYITGGVGSRYEGEAIGNAYELPNERAYSETCAAIAHVMWAWRMLLTTGEARFADALETALYNGTLAGVSLDGRSYFYENPLADRGEHRRQNWFTCACCPPNIARTLASLPGYVYSTSHEGLWVHLFASSTATAMLEGGEVVTVAQETEYPWDGTVRIELRPQTPSTFTLFVRIPGWCPDAKIRVNGAEWPAEAQPGAYVDIKRRWEPGDVVELSLAMPVRLMASHPHVTNNTGRVAITRGPLVYCMEGADHPGVDVWDVALPSNTPWEVAREPDLPGGIVTLRTQGVAAAVPTTGLPLYQPYDPAPRASRTVPLTAIPYYAWANREPGPMQTWIPIASVVDSAESGEHSW